MQFAIKNGNITLYFAKGTLTSFCYAGVEICAKPSALFNVRLTDKEGKIVDYSACQAQGVEVYWSLGTLSRKEKTSLPRHFLHPRGHDAGSVYRNGGL